MKCAIEGKHICRDGDFWGCGNGCPIGRYLSSTRFYYEPASRDGWTGWVYDDTCRFFGVKRFEMLMAESSKFRWGNQGF